MGIIKYIRFSLLMSMADKERVNGVKDPYQIKGIPFLLVIDPSGKIAFAGHGPDELSDFLSKNL